MESIVGQMEVGEQNRRRLQQCIEEDIIKRILEVERTTSWRPDFDKWTTLSAGKWTSLETDIQGLRAATQQNIITMQGNVERLARTVEDRGTVQHQQYVELLGKIQNLEERIDQVREDRSGAVSRRTATSLSLIAKTAASPTTIQCPSTTTTSSPIIGTTGSIG